MLLTLCSSGFVSCSEDKKEDGGEDEGESSTLVSQQPWQVRQNQPTSPIQQAVNQPAQEESKTNSTTQSSDEQEAPKTPESESNPKTDTTPESTREATPASLTASETTVVFTDALITTTEEFELTLSNIGELTATDLEASLISEIFSFKGGAYPGTGGDCGSQLAGLENCKVVLVASSSSAGDFQESLAFLYNEENTFEVDLNFSAVSPASLVINTSIDYTFSDTAPGAQLTADIHITNSGGYHASSISLQTDLSMPFYFPAGFPGSGSDCQAQLSARATCSLRVTFSPTSIGTYADSFSLNYFDGLASQSSTQNISGDSSAVAALSISDGSTFIYDAIAIGSSYTKHFIIENIGQVTASSIDSSSLEAPFSFAGGSFPGTGGTCSDSLTAGAQCTIAVTYSPTVSGQFYDAIDIEYNDGANSSSISRPLSARATDLYAISQTITTALDTAVSLTLASSGGLESKSYSVLVPPDSGSLTGTAPNLTYTPDSGFQGIDTFTFTTSDANGTSNTAEVRIFVNPKALFVVSNKNSLNAMDTTFENRLLSAGFTVYKETATSSTLAQADGMDFVAVSESVNSNDVLGRYKTIQMPFVTWERYLWDDMGMSVSQTENGLISSTEIEIIDETHPLANGLDNGAHTVLSSSAQIPYLVTTNDNVQRVATISGDNAKTVMFAYESQVEMTGSYIAPARRVGMFLPNGGGNTDATGTAMIDKSINYLMSGIVSVMRDHFQREDSDEIGQGWIESESPGHHFSISSGKVSIVSDGGSYSPLARRGFASHDSGRLSIKFRLNMNHAGGNSNYQFRIQLGQGDLMVDANPEEPGVAVNLVWGGTGDGLTTEGGLGYVADGTVTEITNANSGEVEVWITADLDSSTYEVSVEGTSVGSIAFENTNVEIDTIRFYGHHLDTTQLSNATIDNIRIYQGK